MRNEKANCRISPSRVIMLALDLILIAVILLGVFFAIERPLYTYFEERDYTVHVETFVEHKDGILVTDKGEYSLNDKLYLLNDIEPGEGIHLTVSDVSGRILDVKVAGESICYSNGRYEEQELIYDVIASVAVALLAAIFFVLKNTMIKNKRLEYSALCVGAILLSFANYLTGALIPNLDLEIAYLICGLLWFVGGTVAYVITRKIAIFPLISFVCALLVSAIMGALHTDSFSDYIFISVSASLASSLLLFVFLTVVRICTKDVDIYRGFPKSTWERYELPIVILLLIVISICGLMTVEIPGENGSVAVFEFYIALIVLPLATPVYAIISYKCTNRVVMPTFLMFLFRFLAFLVSSEIHLNYPTTTELVGVSVLKDVAEQIWDCAIYALFHTGICVCIVLVLFLIEHLKRKHFAKRWAAELDNATPACGNADAQDEN